MTILNKIAELLQIYTYFECNYLRQTWTLEMSRGHIKTF